MLHKVREREGQGMRPSPMRSGPTPRSDLSNLAIHDTQMGDETGVALANAVPAVEQTGAFPGYQCGARRHCRYQERPEGSSSSKREMPRAKPKVRAHDVRKDADWQTPEPLDPKYCAFRKIFFAYCFFSLSN